MLSVRVEAEADPETQAGQQQTLDDSLADHATRADKLAAAAVATSDDAEAEADPETLLPAHHPCTPATHPAGCEQ